MDDFLETIAVRRKQGLYTVLYYACWAVIVVFAMVAAFSLAGVMFSDADLFGVPLRIVVSPKGLKNGTIEIATRDKSMKEIVPQAEAVDFAYDYVVKELEKLDCRL